MKKKSLKSKGLSFMLFSLFLIACKPDPYGYKQPIPCSGTKTILLGNTYSIKNSNQNGEEIGTISFFPKDASQGSFTSTIDLIGTGSYTKSCDGGSVSFRSDLSISTSNMTVIVSGADEYADTFTFLLHDPNTGLGQVVFADLQ